MSAKYTKGPWHVDAHMNVMADGGLVAFPGIAAGFDQAANARLIAAAPELLEVARMVVENYQGGGDEQSVARAARAAISKATGEQA